MVNSKKLIAGLGVVAGLGVAMLPLTSYATDAAGSTPSTDTGATQTIRAEVAPTFTLTVTSNKAIAAAKATDDALAITAASGINEELIHTVKVTGNIYGGYVLKMGALDSTDLKFVKDVSQDFGNANRYDSTVKIPTGTTVAKGTSAWGYKKKINEGSYDSAYNALTLSSAATELYVNENTANSKFDDTVLVQFGISVDENQPAGVYEGQVVYTATSIL